ncbi:hypothetical protein K875_00007 [Mycobacterium [tuberculosis] TKK-01-0051]|uniref:FAD/NAD(P)-binding domain-containing protein n=1 Tax=Mycobacterium [tuberculosis] TKK-01-0051 TaxID=1324261 RepID=A0A051UJD4_9MYCO|nr:FAD-dependent oxidoreductase [Mycobacterium colombiense]KBZ69292.1 hypothetical protein K875_00007 [Mycobacterium [tuberculosis] TKK-01-0051]
MMTREHDTLTTDAPYLVIGGGLAATSAAETLAKGRRGNVYLIGNEHYLPYARPPLSKAVLSGSATPTAVLLKSEQFFRDRGIQVVLGDAASAIDTTDRVVTLASGRRMPYKSALVATGLLAAPLQIPGFSLGGVHTLRHLDDALNIRDALAPGRTAVVIGGGFIGCEVAATATSLGVNVHIVEMGSVLMQQALGREVGGVLTARHLRAGVTTHLSATAVEIQGNDHVEGVWLDTGEYIRCDVVIVGVGSRAATAWISDGNIAKAQGGIIVDAYCRTSAQDVYAAGDVAAMYSPLTDRYVRIEHESNAQYQGTVAARNMLGKPTRCDAVPFVWSKQYDLDMWCVGDIRGYDMVDIAGDIARSEFIAAYSTHGRTTGAFGVNSAALAAARQLLRNGAGSFTASELVRRAAS